MIESNGLHNLINTKRININWIVCATIVLLNDLFISKIDIKFYYKLKLFIIKNLCIYMRIKTPLLKALVKVRFEKDWGRVHKDLGTK